MVGFWERKKIQFIVAEMGNHCWHRHSPEIDSRKFKFDRELTSKIVEMRLPSPFLLHGLYPTTARAASHGSFFFSNPFLSSPSFPPFLGWHTAAWCWALLLCAKKWMEKGNGQTTTWWWTDKLPTQAKSEIVPFCPAFVGPIHPANFAYPSPVNFGENLAATFFHKLAFSAP